MNISRPKRILKNTLLGILVVLSLTGSELVGYHRGHETGYQTGIWDGAKMVVEGCYLHTEEGAFVLNGNTGHGLVCQGVDTGVIDPSPGITVLVPPRASSSAGEPETDEEIQNKLKDPRQT